MTAWELSIDVGELLRRDLTSKVVILAISEELLKAAICRLISWRKYWFFGVSSFAIFEAILKFPALLHLPSYVGDQGLRFGIAVFVAVGTSIFHLYSSLLYFFARRIWAALMIGSVLHITYNFAVRLDKTFYFLDFKSAFYAWFYTTMCGIALLIWYLLADSYGQRD